MVSDYPDPQGLPALREQVCDYLARRRGIIAEPADILIVSGTQQAFALAAEVLLDEGDRVVIEDPHYQGARQVLQASGADLVGCAVDSDGIVTAQLPQHAPVRLAVVTPSHQFPTGVVLSLARRMELLTWAERAGCWLIEDDYDGEFRYDARPLAALKSLDRAGQVLYIGTFSKVLFPALRLGYMVLPAQLRDAFVAAKWLADRGCPAIEQAALARLMASGAFERHLRATAKALKTRRAALLGALERHVGNAVEVADSSAGMHVLAWLPGLRAAQMRELIERARERGLGLYPIAPYYLRQPQRQGLLLGYADLPPADLDVAMRLLGECLGTM
jgi:GntR family transcriptional regulator/MocR family aminotransferase